MPNYAVETRTRADAYVATLPHRNLQYEIFLNKPGGIRWDLPLRHAAVTPETVKPGLHEVRIVRNDATATRGPLWDATPSSGEDKIACAGAALLDYLDVRRIDADVEYDTIDQSTIAWDLIADTQALPNGDFGLVQGALAMGVTRSMKWKKYDGVYILDAITDISELDTGFDFDINPTTRAFNTYYPRRQRDLGLTLNYPETIRGYSVNIMGKYLRNDILMQGKKDTWEIATDAASQAEYGLRHYVSAFKDATTVTELTARAGKIRDLRRAPKYAYSISIRADIIDIFDANVMQLGDMIGVNIQDGYVSVSGKLRWVGAQVTVGKNGEESVSLYMDDPREVE